MRGDLTRDEKIATARRLRAEGVTLADIATRLGVTGGTVWKWCNPEKAAAADLKSKGRRPDRHLRETRYNPASVGDGLRRALQGVAIEVRVDTTTKLALAVPDPGPRLPLGREALESRYRNVVESDAAFLRGNLILLAAACVEMAAQLEARAAAA